MPPTSLRIPSFFSANTLHVVVVDPGVGSERAIHYVEIGSQRILGPDNGCLATLFSEAGLPTVLRQVRASRFFRPSVAPTFHGRDIFAPVGAHLSLGLNPARLGPSVSQWVRLELPQPKLTKNGVKGEVAFVDPFGYLISNIPAEMVRQQPGILRIGKGSLKRFAWVRSYAEASPGDLAALISSNGILEVAIVQGNAARRMGAWVGTPLGVGFTR